MELDKKGNQMTVTSSEIIKQFVYQVDGLNYNVYGRIVKIIEEGEVFYRWEISHNYKPAQNAGIYYPSTISGNSATEMEEHLRVYAENFTAEFEVRENSYY